MSHEATMAVSGLLILAAAIWIGGYVAIGVVARTAASALDPAARVAFFRGLGRSYGVVGSAALALGYLCGAALIYGRAWDEQLTATAVVATALVVTTAVGVRQARRMSRIRQAALAHPEASAEEVVRRGAARAGLLRGAIGLLSLVLLALGVLLAT